MPAGFSSASVCEAFSRVSREASSGHVIGRLKSSAAIFAATRASGAASCWPQPTLPLKAIGAPVSRPSHRP